MGGHDPIDPVFDQHRTHAGDRAMFSQQFGRGKPRFPLESSTTTGTRSRIAYPACRVGPAFDGQFSDEFLPQTASAMM